MGLTRFLAAALVAALVLGLGGAVAAAEPVVNTAPPTLDAAPRVGVQVTTSPGTWTPAGTTHTYQWLRDGSPIAGATGPSYRPEPADRGRLLSVSVTATAPDGGSAPATSAPAKVRAGLLLSRKRPSFRGTPRYTRTLTARPGRWSGGAVTVRYRWLRSGKPITGATKRRYRLGHEDVGKRIRVRVTARRAGYAKATRLSRARKVRHRIGVRARVTYRVETRGRIATSLATFRRQARQTYADPRGWRNAGVEFREVRRGGDFSLVLSEASRLPSFSSQCSKYYSCRVGRNVIINQDRWTSATPSWNAAGGDLRGYRHMVVNHETGHWLGHGHRGCPGKGRAPVMMQQSKGLHGCTHNPWPVRSELWIRR